MPSTDYTRPAYELAFVAVPYVFLAAAGVAFLLWGVLDLVPVLTTRYGTPVDLFEALAVLVVGVVLLFYAAPGALVATLRTSGFARPDDGTPESPPGTTSRPDFPPSGVPRRPDSSLLPLDRRPSGEP